jgi:hypothetical protein
MFSLKRSFLHIFAAILCLLTASFFISPQLAHAASSSSSSHLRTAVSASYYNCGGSCFNKDPYSTGCANNAYDAHDIGVYDNFGQKLLSIHNWYSTSCGTNWNVTYPTYSNAYFIQISIQSSGFNTTLLCEPTICTQAYTGTGSPLWTNMVFSPGSPPTTATACGAAYSYNDNHRYQQCVTA